MITDGPLTEELLGQQTQQVQPIQQVHPGQPGQLGQPAMAQQPSMIDTLSQIADPNDPVQDFTIALLGFADSIDPNALDQGMSGQVTPEQQAEELSIEEDLPDDFSPEDAKMLAEKFFAMPMEAQVSMSETMKAENPRLHRRIRNVFRIHAGEMGRNHPLLQMEG